MSISDQKNAAAAAMHRESLRASAVEKAKSVEDENQFFSPAQLDFTTRLQGVKVFKFRQRFTEAVQNMRGSQRIMGGRERVAATLKAQVQECACGACKHTDTVLVEEKRSLYNIHLDYGRRWKRGEIPIAKYCGQCVNCARLPPTATSNKPETSEFGGAYVIAPARPAAFCRACGMLVCHECNSKESIMQCGSK